MKKITIAILAAFAITGCASTDYKYYKEIQVEYAKAEAERYKAMSKIAETGDSTTKVAAMFALQGSQAKASGVQVAAPKSTAETLLQWAGIILPTAVQAYGINAQKQTSIVQSNNSALVAQSTNQAFVDIAGKIQAPAANVTTTLSGTGVLGNGTYTTAANPTTTTTTTTTTDRHDTTDNHSVVNPPGGQVCGIDATTGAPVCQ